MESLLEAENEQQFYEHLLLQAAQSTGLQQPDLPQGKTVIPKPGFCLKTKTSDNKKVFINICKSENLPVPKDVSDEDLVKLLDSEDPSSFRIPMSLGEPHAELDKSGKGCTAYDVVINNTFYERVQTSKVLLGFFLTVVLEGLENKYGMELDRNWVMLKNRKFVGSLPEQNIRTQSKPWIMEMDSSEMGSEPKKPLISEISSTQQPPKPKGSQPPLTILQEPPEGHPEFLVAEIHMPKVKSAATMTLDVGEDRILLETRSGIYHLDIYLPYNIVQEETGAQFNRKTKILTLTMPVQPS